MALPTPGAGKRGLVSFELFGFPVTIHASFLLVVAALGYSEKTGVRGAVIWLGVVVVSVLAHELGHAFVARPVGGSPRIDLYMLAGLTTWQPARASRGRRVAVSVAGPLFGVGFGLTLLLAYGVLDPVPNSVVEQALSYGIFANLAWGILNLLPMLPLDGGQVLYALMPGDETARLRRAAAFSLGVAALVALGAVAVHEVYAAILVVLFAAGNVQTLNATRGGTGPAAPNPLVEADRALTAGDPALALSLLPDPAYVTGPGRSAVAMLRAAALLRLGSYREAQDTLLGVEASTRIDPAFEAAVLAANGQERLAYERLVPALPYVGPWGARELTLLLLRTGQDPERWLTGVNPAAAPGVAAAYTLAGRPDDAARWAAPQGPY